MKKKNPGCLSGMPGFFFAGIACRLGRAAPAPPRFGKKPGRRLRFYMDQGGVRVKAAFMAAGIADGFVDDGLHKFRTGMNLNEFTRIGCVVDNSALAPRINDGCVAHGRVEFAACVNLNKARAREVFAQPLGNGKRRKGRFGRFDGGRRFGRFRFSSHCRFNRLGIHCRRFGLLRLLAFGLSFRRSGGDRRFGRRFCGSRRFNGFLRFDLNELFFLGRLSLRLAGTTTALLLRRFVRVLA